MNNNLINRPFISITILLFVSSCASTKYSTARAHHYWYQEERDKAGLSLQAGDCMKAEREMLEAIRVSRIISVYILPDEKYSSADFAEGYKLLGHIYSDEKCQKYPEALAAYTTSLQIHEKTYGKNSPEYANVLNDVAWGYYYQQGDYDQAEKLLKEALMTYESSGNNIGLEIMTLTNLGEVYQAQHKDDLAESMYRKMYEHVNNWYYEDRSKKNISTMALRSYATFLRNQGRDEEANSIELRVSTFQQ